jgi:hypothetical protein
VDALFKNLHVYASARSLMLDQTGLNRTFVDLLKEKEGNDAKEMKGDSSPLVSIHVVLTSFDLMILHNHV